MSLRRLADEMAGTPLDSPSVPTLVRVEPAPAPVPKPAPQATFNADAARSDYLVAKQILERRNKEPHEYVTHDEIRVQHDAQSGLLRQLTERFTTTIAPAAEQASRDLARLKQAAADERERSAEAEMAKAQRHEELAQAFEASDPKRQAKATDNADAADTHARKAAIAAQGASMALERRGSGMQTSIDAAAIMANQIAGVTAEVARLDAWLAAFRSADAFRKTIKSEIAKHGPEHAKAMRHIVGRIIAIPSKSEIVIPEPHPRVNGHQLDHNVLREGAVADRIESERFKAQQEREKARDD